jgi:hypothetical protein
MNITGLIFLKEKGFPIMDHTLIFREISEVSDEHLDKFDKWAMEGFDDRTNISDAPYKIKKFRFLNLEKEKIKETFEELNLIMNFNNVPFENRIFLICRSFQSSEVIMSGHMLKDSGKIFLDIKHGNKPSGIDWTPDVSFVIDLKEQNDFVTKIWDLHYKDHLTEILDHFSNMIEDGYADFTLLNDGKFFYHDFNTFKKGQLSPLSNNSIV